MAALLDEQIFNEGKRSNLFYGIIFIFKIFRHCKLILIMGYTEKRNSGNDNLKMLTVSMA